MVKFTEKIENEFEKKLETKTEKNIDDLIKNIYQLPTQKEIAFLKNLINEIQNENQEYKTNGSKITIEKTTKVEGLNLNNEYDRSIINQIILEQKDNKYFQNKLKDEALQTRRRLVETIANVSKIVASFF